MTSEVIIRKTEAFVKQALQSAEAGHDWWHIERVRNLALQIAREEKANLFVVEMGALLHDIADSKFHDGNESKGPLVAKQFLQSIDLEPEAQGHILRIIENISFRKSLDEPAFTSLELRILQDADRLDAMGAIGIARAFNYGGYKNRIFYDPKIPPIEHLSSTSYKNSTAPTINHFYEKLLLLKDKMHSSTGKRLARERHEFMKAYLEQFYAEWRGEK